MSGLLKEIMGALPEDFVRRMRNWARAAAGSSVGYAAVNWSLEPSDPQSAASLPVLQGEAEDTARALATLEIRYRRAVELFWSWEGSEVTVLARRCGGIDKKTYAKRVIEGHDRLRAEIARQAEAWRRQREATQAAVTRARFA